MFRRLVYLLTSYDGRITRRAFWLSLPLLAFISVILFFGGAFVDFWLFNQLGLLDSGLVDFGPLSIIAVAVTWYLQLAVIVKRLHDRNKRARWLWLAQVPILGTIWLVIETGFLRGTAGPNDWGDDPRSRPGSNVAVVP